VEERRREVKFVQDLIRCYYCLCSNADVEYRNKYDMTYAGIDFDSIAIFQQRWNLESCWDHYELIGCAFLCD